MMIPSAPPLGRLGIASPDDTLRLGLIATAGFYYSEQFTWERPYHAEYPHDTLICFQHEVMEFVKSPEYIVLVATDKYDPDESSKTSAIIPENNGWPSPAPGTEVAVGMAIWKLEAGSKRIGHFHNGKGSYPHLPESQHRDENPHRVRKLSDRAKKADGKYLHGLSSMERIVVHPAYWKRNHGSILARWGMRLADVDCVSQGVMATSMGETLFNHLGYQLLETAHIDGDEDAPDEVLNMK